MLKGDGGSGSRDLRFGVIGKDVFVYGHHGLVFMMVAVDFVDLR